MLHKNYINGEWLHGADAKENINPSDVSDVVGLYAQADAAQAEHAIAAAKAALPAWSATTPQQRADVLEAIGVELLARKDEIGLLAQSFKKMQDQIKHQLNELQHSRQQLEHLAGHDVLTGLPNRQFLGRWLPEVLADDSPVCIGALNIDEFREVNERFGFAAGDGVLHPWVAARIAESQPHIFAVLHKLFD